MVISVNKQETNEEKTTDLSLVSEVSSTVHYCFSNVGMGTPMGTLEYCKGYLIFFFFNFHSINFKYYTIISTIQKCSCELNILSETEAHVFFSKRHSSMQRQCMLTELFVKLHDDKNWFAMNLAVFFLLKMFCVGQESLAEKRFKGGTLFEKV